MLGEAGIGHHLLSLVFPDTPSVLFPTGPLQVRSAPDAKKREEGLVDASVVALRRDYLNAYFGRTLAAVRAFATGAPRPEHAIVVSPTLDEVRRLEAAIRTVVAEEPDPLRRTLLLDAVKIDFRRLEVCLNGADFTHAVVRDLRNVSVNEIDWDRALLALAPQCRVLELAFDWRSWHLQKSPNDMPVAVTNHLLVYQEGEQVFERALSPFAYHVFAGLRGPMSLVNLMLIVEGHIEAKIEHRSLLAAVASQVKEGYRLGVVLVCNEQSALVSN
jgi:hypothetical protein